MNKGGLKVSVTPQVVVRFNRLPAILSGDEYGPNSNFEPDVFLSSLQHKYARPLAFSEILALDTLTNSITDTGTQDIASIPSAK